MSRPVVFIKRINLLAHLRSRHLLKANGLIETHTVFIVQIVYWPSTVCKPVTIALKKSFFYTFLPHLQRGVQPCSRLILFSRFPRSCLFVQAAECTWSSRHTRFIPRAEAVLTSAPHLVPLSFHSCPLKTERTVQQIEIEKDFHFPRQPYMTSSQPLVSAN